MSKFCFYHGNDVGLIDRLRRAAVFCWNDVEELMLDSFHLFIAVDDFKSSSYETETLIGALSGYAKTETSMDDRSYSTEFFSQISYKNWPLGDEWAGSFAAVVYSSANQESALCNDLIGHLPLYYARGGNGFIGGTSLIVLGRTLGCEPDPIGVLQRITVPFCNYGRRTILKKVYRLLSGERLKWKSGDAGVRRDFDNSLFRKVSDADVKVSARKVFDCLRHEIDAAIGDHQKLSIAASGGWDSRLILGGIPKDRYSISCLTYGGEDHYETRIAQKCAEAVGASHECFSIEERYFPSRLQTEALVRETESANYFEWFGIIDKARQSGGKAPLLLGDLCESIDGRYMTRFSTRKARIDSFVNGMFGKREVFEERSDRNFKQWCDEKTVEITSALLANLKHLSGDLIGSLTEGQIRAAIASDLETSFSRVSAQTPPFSAAYDELFIWFHRIRFLLGNQINWLSSAFRPISPGLSMSFLRLITTIHPRQRIRKRLMNAIVDLPEFDELSRIPSAQIPFISSRAPALLKDIVWGLRSGLDQVLIRRSLKNKKADGRQRVLHSLDYVKEYRRRSTQKNVESWFSGKYIESNHYLQMVRDRANLDAWTLINVDVAAPANISIILDLCKSESDNPAAKTIAVAAMPGTSTTALSQTRQIRDLCW